MKCDNVKKMGTIYFYNDASVDTAVKDSLFSGFWTVRKRPFDFYVGVGCVWFFEKKHFVKEVNKKTGSRRGRKQNTDPKTSSRPHQMVAPLPETGT